MVRDIEQRIAAVARAQHGVITRTQLLAIGLLPGAVRHHVACGRLTRLHRGVYLVGPLVPPLAREMAAVLACGAHAVLSHCSAARLWCMIAPDDNTAPLDVSIADGRGGMREGVRARRVRSIVADEQTRFEGIPITTPARTLVDLAGVIGERELESVVARAEREALVARDELGVLIERYRGRAGVGALRSVISRSGGPALTRSEAEARFLALVRNARLPAPETNVLVAGCELDFFWRSHNIAVEVDGYRYHSSRAQFERDRRRTAHLAACGIQVIALSWRQIVDDAVATAVQVGQALVRARG